MYFNRLQHTSGTIFDAVIRLSNPSGPAKLKIQGEKIMGALLLCLVNRGNRAPFEKQDRD